MATVAFPSVTITEYSGFISDLHVGLLKVVDHLERSPGSATDTRAAMTAVFTKFGWTVP
jgi:hypothetical protein